MSCNKERPHILVIPEDDANRVIANRFAQEVTHLRRIQVLPPAGGWSSVCDVFVSEHIKGLRNHGHRNVLLLLDFDNKSQRRQSVLKIIPQDVTERVFLLGVRSEPEDLKKAGFGTLEQIGRSLADECRTGKKEIWSHDLMSHNAEELERLKSLVCGFLF